MTQQQPLLRPLNSDQLAPRPSAQAVWNAASAVPPKPSESASGSSLMHPAAFSAPEPVKPADEQPDSAELSLEALISSVSPEESDEEETPDEPDALPTEHMPLPVCVPLFEEAPPKRRFRFWPVLTALLAAGCLAAAWYSGWLKTIFP